MGKVKIYTIYKAINSINGKVYIGFDSNWPRRKISHFKESFNPNYKNYKCYFHSAIRKYGKDTFEWEIIYQSKNRKYTLEEMEPYFIKEYNSFGNGYNLTEGGEGTCGYEPWNKGKMWDEGTKKKISEAKKGKPSPRKGAILSEEIKVKISNSKKGRIPWNKGKIGTHTYKHTEETKEKLKQINLGKKLSEEHKEKIRQSHLGKPSPKKGITYVNK